MKVVIYAKRKLEHFLLVIVFSLDCLKWNCEIEDGTSRHTKKFQFNVLFVAQDLIEFFYLK